MHVQGCLAHVNMSCMAILARYNMIISDATTQDLFFNFERISKKNLNHLKIRYEYHCLLSATPPHCGCVNACMRACVHACMRAHLGSHPGPCRARQVLYYRPTLLSSTQHFSTQ